MRDGLYCVVFSTQIGQGAGVVVLQAGRLWGGDSSMYYVGSYKVEGGAFTASVRVGKHTDSPGTRSVLGVDKGNLSLSGTFTDDSVQTDGTVAEMPNVSFRAALQRLCD